jgi:7-cyano-7-deazaguanine reductase
MNEHTDTPEKHETSLNLVPAQALKTTKYRYAGEPMEVEYWTEEFASLCPQDGSLKTGSLFVRYVPFAHLIELTSLGTYLSSYRKLAILHEHAVKRILDDLVKLCQPKSMTVEADFALQESMGVRAKAHYQRRGA